MTAYSNETGQTRSICRKERNWRSFISDKFSYLTFIVLFTCTQAIYRRAKLNPKLKIVNLMETTVQPTVTIWCPGLKFTLLRTKSTELYLDVFQNTSISAPQSNASRKHEPRRFPLYLLSGNMDLPTMLLSYLIPKHHESWQCSTSLKSDAVPHFCILIFQISPFEKNNIMFILVPCMFQFHKRTDGTWHGRR